jgi:RNAse (barnase) inhibitor barstar
MTRDDLIAFGTARHGEHFIGQLAAELGYSFSQLWRVVSGKSDITRRLELEFKQLHAQHTKERKPHE